MRELAFRSFRHFRFDAVRTALRHGCRLRPGHGGFDDDRLPRARPAGGGRPATGQLLGGERPGSDGHPGARRRQRRRLGAPGGRTIHGRLHHKRRRPLGAARTPRHCAGHRHPHVARSPPAVGHRHGAAPGHAGAGASTSHDGDLHGMTVDPDEKIPKTFAYWAAQIDVYNNRLLDGKKRRFPENMLAGAESVLARVWHEHTKTKAYTPITLGEILQKRLFTASGDVNPLTLPRQSSAAAPGQALRLVNGEVVSVEDPQ